VKVRNSPAVAALAEALVAECGTAGLFMEYPGSWSWQSCHRLAAAILEPEPAVEILIAIKNLAPPPA